MSGELIDIMRSMNSRELELQLALQCAPVLTNIKISNLLIIDQSYKEELCDTFSQSAIDIFLLYENECRCTFLLYSKSTMLQHLNKNHVKCALNNLGCLNTELDILLENFSDKYRNYMETKEAFPHEMGVILGYPAQDVLGFIENKGKNYLMSGYWKVYENVEDAAKKFYQYNAAKERILRMVFAGVGVNHILDMHYSTAEQEDTDAYITAS